MFIAGAKEMAKERMWARLGIRNEIRKGRQQVMQCSLEMMLVAWALVLVAACVARFILTPWFPAGGAVVFYNWVVFLHIASTMAWAVLSRATGRGARYALFAAWVGTLTLMISWFAIQPKYSDTTLLFTGFVVLGLGAASLVSQFADMDTPGVTTVLYTGAVLAAFGAAVIGLHYLDAFTWEFSAVWVGASLALVYVCGQLLATWTYLHHNTKVWLVQNTCLFASMSPWSEAVDLFSVFTRKVC